MVARGAAQAAPSAFGVASAKLPPAQRPSALFPAQVPEPPYTDPRVLPTREVESSTIDCIDPIYLIYFLGLLQPKN